MIEAQKHHIEVLCNDGVLIKGLLNVFGERRLVETLNSSAEQFLMLSDVEISYPEEIRSFKLTNRAVYKKESIILNKSDIKWVERIGEQK
ncbi:MAG: hypothetical protein Q8N85_01465 [Candidatus Omnitrophota bacterium]|nr:hypothetical protein [Candidatus Omnitrophota bacterium]